MKCEKVVLVEFAKKFDELPNGFSLVLADISLCRSNKDRNAQIEELVRRVVIPIFKERFPHKISHARIIYNKSAKDYHCVMVQCWIHNPSAHNHERRTKDVVLSFNFQYVDRVFMAA